MTDKEIIDALNYCVQQLDEVKDFLIGDQIIQQAADKKIGKQIVHLKNAIDDILNVKKNYLHLAKNQQKNA